MNAAWIETAAPGSPSARQAEQRSRPERDASGVCPVTPKRLSSAGFHHLLRPQSIHSTAIETTSAIVASLPGNAIAPSASVPVVFTFSWVLPEESSPFRSNQSKSLTCIIS